MKVSELIEILGKCDPNMRVVVDGYEDGYDDPKITSSTRVVIDANWDGSKKNTVWSGRHDFAYEYQHEQNTPVVVIGR